MIVSFVSCVWPKGRDHRASSYKCVLCMSRPMHNDSDCCMHNCQHVVFSDDSIVLHVSSTCLIVIPRQMTLNSKWASL